MAEFFVIPFVFIAVFATAAVLFGGWVTFTAIRWFGLLLGLVVTTPIRMARRGGCRGCGQANPVTARFCRRCGRALPDRSIRSC
jgi:hypothetical protein